MFSQLYQYIELIKILLGVNQLLLQLYILLYLVTNLSSGFENLSAP